MIWSRGSFPAHRVIYDDKAFIPTRGKRGAGGVGYVMTNRMHFLDRKVRKVAADLVEKYIFRKDLTIEFRRGGIEFINFLVRQIVEAVSDLCNLIQGHASLLQAELNRARRKCSGVFL